MTTTPRELPELVIAKGEIELCAMVYGEDRADWTRAGRALANLVDTLSMEGEADGYIVTGLTGYFRADQKGLAEDQAQWAIENYGRGIKEPGNYEVRPFYFHAKTDTRTVVVTEAMDRLLAIADEMRIHKVNHGKHTSPTLIAWADRITAALETDR